MPVFLWFFARVAVRVGGLDVGHGTGALEGCLEVELLVGEQTRGTGAELDGADVVRYSESGLRRCTALVADATGEDGEVVYLHVLAFKDLLLDATYHGGHHAEALRLAETAVVLRHVLGELAQVHSLLDDRIGVPKLVAGAALVVVLLEDVLNHKRKEFEINLMSRESLIFKDMAKIEYNGMAEKDKRCEMLKINIQLSHRKHILYGG